jgi:hypothetical protein
MKITLFCELKHSKQLLEEGPEHSLQILSQALHLAIENS